MELKTRKRLSILILVIGMPIYVIVAVSLMNWLDGRFGRQPIWIELLIYVAPVLLGESGRPLLAGVMHHQPMPAKACWQCWLCHWPLRPEQAHEYSSFID